MQQTDKVIQNNIPMTNTIIFLEQKVLIKKRKASKRDTRGLGKWVALQGLTLKVNDILQITS